jgi:hypothetical protein
MNFADGHAGFLRLDVIMDGRLAFFI